jgi:hypothetical protein
MGVINKKFHGNDLDETSRAMKETNRAKQNRVRNRES